MIEQNVLKSCIRNLIRHLGDDPEREGLIDTPSRVLRSFNTLYGGYNKKAEDVLKTEFKEHGNYTGMIISRQIEFYSTCEHHMLPFFGVAHVGYIPNNNVVGISKLARLVDIHARRLQIQEKMTEDIANDFFNIVKPKGFGIIIEAQHFCMKARGVEKQNALMITSSIKGNFTEHVVREEFLRLVGK